MLRSARPYYPPKEKTQKKREERRLRTSCEREGVLLAHLFEGWNVMSVLEERASARVDILVLGSSERCTSVEIVSVRFGNFEFGHKVPVVVPASEAR